MLAIKILDVDNAKELGMRQSLNSVHVIHWGDYGHMAVYCRRPEYVTL